MASEANTKRAEELLPCPGSDSCRPHLQWGAYHSPICPHAHRPAVAEALDAAEARGAARLRERIQKLREREERYAANAIDRYDTDDLAMYRHSARLLRGLEEEG